MDSLVFTKKKRVNGKGRFFSKGGATAGSPPSTDPLTLEDGTTPLTLEDGTTELTLEG